MYLGIDIGGTKTLIATLDDYGVILNRVKYATPSHYSDFLKMLQDSDFINHDYRAIGIGAPGNIDRKHDLILNFGNLNWKRIHLHQDIERLFKAPVAVENDAKLAGLSEAMLVKGKFSRVLYITISTGIGFAFVDNCQIDTETGDNGGKSILFARNGKFVSWESYISGKAIVSRFGKMAKDIEDPKIWKLIAYDLSQGVMELIAIFEPEVIVFGGSVGNYFERYKNYLKTELERYQIPLIKLPLLKKAERPNDAVIYGCYDYARITFRHE
jgi:predicted NBD/HSP70 family sugar kinase